MDNHSTPVEIVIDEVEILGDRTIPSPIRPFEIPVKLHSYAHWLPEHNVMITGVEIQNIGDLPPFKHREADHYNSKLEGIRQAGYWLDSITTRAKVHYQEITKPAENNNVDFVISGKINKSAQYFYEQAGALPPVENNPAEPVEDQATLTHWAHEQWPCKQCGKINEGRYIDCAECGVTKGHGR